MKISNDLVYLYLDWTKDKNFKTGSVKNFLKENGMPATASASVDFSDAVYRLTGHTIIEHRSNYNIRRLNKQNYIKRYGVTHYSNERWFKPVQIIRNFEQILGAIRCYY